MTAPVDSWGTDSETDSETDYETGLDYESYDSPEYINSSDHKPYITLIKQIKQLK